MIFTRRIARELALKALFQKDVGKQPLDEIFPGIMEQIRYIVIEPIQQISKHDQHIIRDLSRSKTENPEISPETRRLIRQSATLMIKSMQQLVSQAETIICRMVDVHPAISLAQGREELETLIEETNVRITKLSRKNTPFADILAESAEQAYHATQRLLSAFDKHAEDAIQIAEFTRELVFGTRKMRREIDRVLSMNATGWTLARQAAVDRNILRIATYEILYMKDIPIAATINEAIELAKKYSTEESGRFVNGVLGALGPRLLNNADESLPKV